jgi:serine/threonine protein kinase
MAQLFDGLAEMHKVGMVHRDLHGENVLVQRDPDGMPSVNPRAVRIIDFGGAKVYNVLKPRQMSNLAGCMQYFSPERRRGDAFDDRDDVWAVGCHLTELVTGRVIRNRRGCGFEGVDFATSSKHIAEAISECGNSRCRCRQLAEAVLVMDRKKRPRAAAARDIIRCELITSAPGKRRAIGVVAPPASPHQIWAPRRRRVH